MTTQRELIEAHRKQMDADFYKKYPNGQFVVQVWDNQIYIHYNPRRRTSHTTPSGLTMCYHVDESHSTFETHQNSAWGICYKFDNITKALRHAEKLGVPTQLINSYSEKWFDLSLKTVMFTKFERCSKCGYHINYLTGLCWYCDKQ